MARVPQARAQNASAEDDFYGQDEDGFEAGGSGQEGQEGAGDPEDAAIDAGEEQETGGEGDLEGADDDLYDPERVERTAGRAVSRIQRLANENRRMAERIALLESGGRAAATTPVQQTGPQEETEAEFQARLQLLSGDERADARMERFVRQQQRRDFVNTVQAAATADRAKYMDEAQTNPRMLRFKDRVEEEFNKRLNMGQAVSRIDLYYWLVGKHIDENPKTVKRAREAARDRVNRNTVRPAAGGSDVRPGRRGTDERTARARRLDGVQI